MRLLQFIFALALFAGLSQAQVYPWVRNFTTDPTTAPVQFKAACENASGFATVCTTSPSRYLGICVLSCDVSADGQVTFAGLVPVVVDGTTTVGHYCIVSTSVGGDCTDSGAGTYPISGIVIGKIKVASTGAASKSYVDVSPEIVGVSSSGGGFAGTNAQTISYTALTGDSNKLITMNGSSLTLTLPAAVPSATWNVVVLNLHTTALTISRNSLTINGGTSNITLQQYQWAWVFADGAGTNYNAKVPYVAGTNITLTPAANGITVAATGGGVSTVQVNGVAASPARAIVNYKIGGASISDNGSDTTTIAYRDPIATKYEQDFFCRGSNSTTGNVGDLGWYENSNVWAQVAPTAGLPCILRGSTTSTINSLIQICMHGTMTALAAENFSIKVVSSAQTPGGGAPAVRIGYASVVNTASPANSIYLEWCGGSGNGCSTTDTNWFLIQGANARQDTGFPHANTRQAVQLYRIDSTHIGVKVATTLGGLDAVTPFSDPATSPTAAQTPCIWEINSVASNSTIDLVYFDYLLSGLTL